MPKVFISHSSSDKERFVLPLAERLKDIDYELDTQTFEGGKLIEGEILRGITESELILFLISEKALQSDFVQGEFSSALSFWKNGLEKEIIPIIIDPRVSWNDPKIPKIIRDSFILKHIQSVRTVETIVRSSLARISFKFEGRRRGSVFGRDEEISKIVNRINEFASPKLLCTVSSGIEGIGRKSLLREGYRRARVGQDFSEPMQIQLEEEQGLDDFAAKLIDLGILPTKKSDYLSLGHAERFKFVCKYLEEISELNEYILIQDNGAIIRSDRNLVDWFSKLLVEPFEKSKKPMLAISAQFRVDPKEIAKYPRLLSVNLKGLSPTDRATLFSAHLDSGADLLDKAQYEKFLSLFNGHPGQICFASTLILREGPVMAWKYSGEISKYADSQASSVVNSIKNNKEAYFLLQLLSEIGFIDVLKLNDISELKSGGDAINSLVAINACDFLGSQNELISVNSLVGDYIQRNTFDMNEKIQEIIRRWGIDARKALLEDEFSEADARIATKAIALGGGAEIGALLLPSYRLAVIKELYDRKGENRNLKVVVDLCSGLLSSGLMMEDHQEQQARYYLCQALARLKSESRFFQEVKHVKGSNRDFLEGFYFRLAGEYDRAIEKQQEVLRRSRGISKASRELLQNLMAQKKFSEAFSIAKDQYNRRGANPFVLQPLIRCLVMSNVRKGKVTEIEGYIDELNQIGSRLSLQMALSEGALYKAYCLGQIGEALAMLDSSINEYPGVVYPILAKISVCELGRNWDQLAATIELLGRQADREPQYRDRKVYCEVKLLVATGKTRDAIRLADTLPRESLFYEGAQAAARGIDVDLEPRFD